MTRPTLATVCFFSLLTACTEQAEPRESLSALPADAGPGLPREGRSEPQATIAIGTSASDPPDYEPTPRCLWQPIACPSAAPLDLHAETARGHLHLERVGVSYWVGFTYETQLNFAGTLAGAPVQLALRVADDPSRGPLGPLVEPGSYHTGLAWTDLFARFENCSFTEQLAQAELLITRHDGPQREDAGVADGGLRVALAGELVIRDPGWSLRVPFSLSEVCQR